jgi:hypothetical protein
MFDRLFRALHIATPSQQIGDLFDMSAESIDDQSVTASRSPKYRN